MHNEPSDPTLSMIFTEVQATRADVQAMLAGHEGLRQRVEDLAAEESHCRGEVHEFIWGNGTEQHPGASGRLKLLESAESRRANRERTGVKWALGFLGTVLLAALTWIGERLWGIIHTVK